MRSVELDEDAVRVQYVDAADVSVGVGERLDGAGQFDALVQQLLGQGLYVGDAEGYVADAHLVQLDGLPIGIIAGVAGEGQRGSGAIPVGEADPVAGRRSRR